MNIELVPFLVQVQYFCGIEICTSGFITHIGTCCLVHGGSVITATVHSVKVLSEVSSSGGILVYRVHQTVVKRSVSQRVVHLVPGFHHLNKRPASFTCADCSVSVPACNQVSTCLVNHDRFVRDHISPVSNLETSQVVRDKVKLPRVLVCLIVLVQEE